MAACASAITLQKAQADKFDMTFSSAPVSSTATSYTAQCLQLQQSGADYVQLNIAAAAGAKFVQDCQAQSYNPTWGTSEQAIGKELLAVKGATMYGPAYVFPSAAKSPAVTAVHRCHDPVRRRVTTGARARPATPGSACSSWPRRWRRRGANPTRKDVITGLNSIKDDDLGGLIPNKITFTAGKPIPFGGSPCSFVVGVKDGKTIAPNGLTPVCPSA